MSENIENGTKMGKGLFGDFTLMVRSMVDIPNGMIVGKKH